jgi:hypothetical protein
MTVDILGQGYYQDRDRPPVIISQIMMASGTITGGNSEATDGSSPHCFAALLFFFFLFLCLTIAHVTDSIESKSLLIFL